MLDRKLVSLFAVWMLIAAPAQIRAQEVEQEIEQEKCKILKNKQEKGDALSEEEREKMVVCLRQANKKTSGGGGSFSVFRNKAPLAPLPSE